MTVGPFDVPAFSLEGTALADQREAVITDVFSQVQRTFLDSGVIFTTEAITALPTNPAAGTVLSLADDGSRLMTIGSDQTVVLYGESYNRFYVGSNGYITFGQPDRESSESLTNHFNVARISALFDDLNPSAAG